MTKIKTWIVVFVAAVTCIGLVYAQTNLEPPNRKELKRADVKGTNLEVIISVIENQPGETIARHIHHGEEAFYVLQGTTIELPDGKRVELPTGAAAINPRDVPHAGFKIVGDTALRYVAVHFVDKGAPLYDAPPK